MIQKYEKHELTFSSKERAWASINKIFPEGFTKDEICSKEVGYDIYASLVPNYYIRIYDYTSAHNQAIKENKIVIIRFCFYGNGQQATIYIEPNEEEEKDNQTDNN